eukprot:scaffold10980_cov125-Isochrysis_galbana.AAC.2
MHSQSMGITPTSMKKRKRWYCCTNQPTDGAEVPKLLPIVNSEKPRRADIPGCDSMRLPTSPSTETAKDSVKNAMTVRARENNMHHLINEMCSDFSSSRCVETPWTGALPA